MHASGFALDDHIIYLNHAAVAPWPVRTATAVAAFADENTRQGSLDYMGWLETEAALREQLRLLINARSSDEIALLKNTSEALSVVAWGLPWQAGDSIVISNQEFPSNRVVWESLAGQGVNVIAADLDEGDTPEDALIDALNDTTRLLSISSVQYGTGLRIDLAALGKACRERDVLFCVDAIQGIGALPFDAQACQADFVMADGHKWMLGPEGLALFYCRREIMDRLVLREYGWHMLQDHMNFDSHSNEVADTARRFECGSPNMIGIHALHASLGLLLETGMDSVGAQVLDNSRFMFDFFAEHADEFELITPTGAGRHAGIVTFRPRREPAATLFEQLRSQHVMCALRGGGIRFSPHFYTPRKHLFRALELLLA